MAKKVDRDFEEFFAALVAVVVSVGKLLLAIAVAGFWIWIFISLL